jgi:hypothetical protein
MLAAFRQRGRKDHALLAAFCQAGWAEAFPEIYASVQETVAHGNWAEAAVRMHAMECLPPEGRARLHDVLRNRQMPLGVRLGAARELSGQSNRCNCPPRPGRKEGANRFAESGPQAAEPGCHTRTSPLPGTEASPE